MQNGLQYGGEFGTMELKFFVKEVKFMLWTLKKCWYRIYQRVFKVAMCFMDWSAPQLLEGAGSVLRLPELIKSKGVKKVLVVTDKG